MSFKFDNNTKKDVEYIEDEVEFFDLRNDDSDEQHDDVEQNDVSNINDGKLKKKKNNTFKKFKFNLKNKETSDFIVLDSVAADEEDFIIVNNETGKFKLVLSKMKIVVAIAIFCLLTVLAYFLMSYRLINEDIKGSTYHLGDLSMVSRDYQPNLDELKVGDKIICLNDNLDWLPIALKYDKLTYKSRNGVIIFAEDDEGNKHKIQSVDVDLIAR